MHRHRSHPYSPGPATSANGNGGDASARARAGIARALQLTPATPASTTEGTGFLGATDPLSRWSSSSSSSLATTAAAAAHHPRLEEEEPSGQQPTKRRKRISDLLSGAPGPSSALPSSRPGSAPTSPGSTLPSTVHSTLPTHPTTTTERSSPTSNLRGDVPGLSYTHGSTSSGSLPEWGSTPNNGTTTTTTSSPPVAASHQPSYRLPALSGMTPQISRDRHPPARLEPPIAGSKSSPSAALPSYERC